MIDPAVVKEYAPQAGEGLIEIAITILALVAVAWKAGIFKAVQSVLTAEKNIESAREGRDIAKQNATILERMESGQKGIFHAIGRVDRLASQHDVKIDKLEEDLAKTQGDIGRVEGKVDNLKGSFDELRWEHQMRVKERRHCLEPEDDTDKGSN